MDWLRGDIGYPVALVAYNGHKFDGPVLLRHMQKHDVAYDDVILYFIDPYVYLKVSRRPYLCHVMYRH